MDLIKTYCESDSDVEDVITSSDVVLANFDMNPASERDSAGNADVVDSSDVLLADFDMNSACDRDSAGNADVLTSSDVVMANFHMNPGCGRDCNDIVTPTPINPDDGWLHEDDILTPSPINPDDAWLHGDDIVRPTPINPDDAWLHEDELPMDCSPINYELEELQEHKIRMVYLVTYSQADVATFDRRTFAHAVRHCFNSGKAKVIRWVCSMENHADGGKHLHMAVLLDKLKRWKGVKNMMYELHNVVLHFSDFHSNYPTAWNYVVKEDKEYIESPNHKKMVRNTPARTSRASAKRKSNARQGKGKKKTKKEARLTPVAFTQVIRKHNIKRMIELYVFINEEQQKGNMALPEFFYNRTMNKIEELISTTWAVEDAPKTLEREKKSRLEILAQYADETQCLCDGEWLRLALQTLSNNGVSRQQFSASVMKLLQFGRKKGNNILIKGEASCGKSFLFYPLKEIFHCFCNPPTGTFNWLEVGDAEVIFLNDFRWSPGVIPWEQLLQLLEGDEVKFPTPKNHCKNNILFKKDCPIFATSSDEIVSNRIGSLMIKETKMMRKRWNVYSFTYEIPDDEVNEDIKPCGVCFCNLVMREELFD